MPDENGGIIIKLDANSPLRKAGLQEKDVIRIMDGTEIKKANDLLNVYQASKWKGQVKVEAMRNQQTLQVNLLLK